MMSDSVMPPTPASTTWTWTSDCGSFAISSSNASSEPETSALSTRLSSCSTPPRASSKIVSSERFLLRAARLRLALEAEAALAGELARPAVVLDHAHVLARLGHGVEAEHLDRLGRRRLLDLAALVVVQRAHAAPVGAGDERVADLQRAAVDEHGHDRAAARVELGLDHHAGRLDVRVGLELLDLGQQQDRLQQVVEVGLGLRRRRRRTSSRRPTPRAAGRAGSSRCARGRAARPPCRSC